MDSHRHVWAVRAAAVLVVFVVGACGGGQATAPGSTASPSAGATPGQPSPVVAPATQAPAAGQTVDACSVLTDAEIQQVAGYPVLSKAAGPVMGIFQNGCAWELDSEAEEMIAWTIEVGVISPGGRQYFDTYLSFPDQTDPVPGLGDAAVTDGLGITAVKGDSLVSVFVIAFGEREDEITRELTEIALTRVP